MPPLGRGRSLSCGWACANHMTPFGHRPCGWRTGVGAHSLGLQNSSDSPNAAAKGDTQTTRAETTGPRHRGKRGWCSSRKAQCLKGLGEENGGRLHTYSHMHAHTCAYTRKHAHTHVHTCTYANICVHMCAPIHAYTHALTCIHSHICMYTQAHPCTHTCTAHTSTCLETGSHTPTLQ